MELFIFFFQTSLDVSQQNFILYLNDFEIPKRFSFLWFLNKSTYIWTDG